jgi:hypothetical protein
MVAELNGHAYLTSIYFLSRLLNRSQLIMCLHWVLQGFLAVHTGSFRFFFLSFFLLRVYNFVFNHTKCASTNCIQTSLTMKYSKIVVCFLYIYLRWTKQILFGKMNTQFRYTDINQNINFHCLFYFIIFLRLSLLRNTLFTHYKVKIIHCFWIKLYSVVTIVIIHVHTWCNISH